MKSRGVSQPLKDMVNFVVCRSTMNQFLQHNILCDNLHNSRKKSAYETLLTVTIQDSAKNLSKGRQVDIILLNFAKAFDKVRLLGPYARFYGVRGNTNKWTVSFFEHQKQQDNKYSLKITTLQVQMSCQECPRARSSAPLLLLAYINNLPEVTKSSNARIFADDTHYITNQHGSDILQKDLTALEEWEKMWQMDFKASKCSFIHILLSKRRHTIDSSYNVHGHFFETLLKFDYACT